MKLPVHELVETVVLSYLGSGVTGGFCGSLKVVGDAFAVYAAGRFFKVRTVAAGWSVTTGDFEGIDSDLLEAARLALNP